MPMLKSVHKLHGALCTDADELTLVRCELQEARNELERAQAKVKQLKHRLNEKTNNLRKTTKEFERVIDDLKSPRPFYSLSRYQSKLWNRSLKQQFEGVEDDIAEAWSRINDAEHDLNFETITILQALCGLVEPPKDEDLSMQIVDDSDSVFAPNLCAGEIITDEIITDDNIPTNDILKPNQNSSSSS